MACRASASGGAPALSRVPGRGECNPEDPGTLIGFLGGTFPPWMITPPGCDAGERDAAAHLAIAVVSFSCAFWRSRCCLWPRSSTNDLILSVIAILDRESLSSDARGRPAAESGLSLFGRA